jgi:hypothetical protein
MKSGKRKIEGIVESGGFRFLYVDDQECSLDVSLKFRNHSPDGFNWGYSGSGPAQAALAILLECRPYREALAFYQQFKEDFIAKQKKDEAFEVEVDIDQWMREVASR